MRDLLMDGCLVVIGAGGCYVAAEAFDVGAPALGVLCLSAASACFALVVLSRWPKR
jgi:hypothetical protein